MSPMNCIDCGKEVGLTKHPNTIYRCEDCFKKWIKKGTPCPNCDNDYNEKMEML